MAWRIFKIAVYMLCNIFIYFLAGLGGARRREAFLAAAYLRWSHYVLREFHVALEVRGREFLPPPEGKPRVFLCNHQSQLDIPSLGVGLREPAGFVAKKELGRIPILSYWMKRVGCVIIDRGDQQGARKSLEKAAQSLGPHPLVVFPEGTRSKSGQLLPIKLGGVRMAVLAGAQVIPVHIRNSRNAFEARSPKPSGPVAVTLRFFPPLDTRGWADGKASWLKVKDYVEGCWAEALTAG